MKSCEFYSKCIKPWHGYAVVNHVCYVPPLPLTPLVIRATSHLCIKRYALTFLLKTLQGRRIEAAMLKIIVIISVIKTISTCAASGKRCVVWKFMVAFGSF